MVDATTTAPPDRQAAAFRDPAEVVRRLERAPAGSAELDLAVFLATGAADVELSEIAARLLAEGLAASTLRDLFGAEIPAYTRSLDAALEHESIVATVFVRERSLWAAVHRTRDGREVVAWAATEALARRAAALKPSRIAGERADGESAEGDTAEGAESRRWKVLF